MEIDWNHQGSQTKQVAGIDLRKVLEKPDQLDLVVLECAKKHLDEYAYIPPPKKPEILVRFDIDKESKEWIEKSNEDKESFKKKLYARADVVEFVEQRGNNESFNLSNAHALEGFMCACGRTGDNEGGRKFWEVYNKYPTTLSYGAGVIWRKNEFLKRFPIKDKTTDI